MESILQTLFGTPASWQASDILTSRREHDQVCIEREVCDVKSGGVIMWGTVEVYRGPAPSDDELAGLMASKVGAQRYQ